MASTPPPGYIHNKDELQQWAAGHARRVQDRARGGRRRAEYERKVSRVQTHYKVDYIGDAIVDADFAHHHRDIVNDQRTE